MYLHKHTVKIWIPNYSQHSNTGLCPVHRMVKLSGCRMVRFSNGKSLSIWKLDKLCPVFEWSIYLPFDNRTIFCPEKWPFEYRTVRYSNVDCMSGFRMVNHLPFEIRTIRQPDTFTIRSTGPGPVFEWRLYSEHLNGSGIQMFTVPKLFRLSRVCN